MRIKMKTCIAALAVSLVLMTSLTASVQDLRLVQAARARDSAAVAALLKQHADANAAQPDGATALHWAAHWDDRPTADLLIRAGAAVDAANIYGVTPLWLASVNGSAAMVEKLIKAGARPNTALPSGETVLMAASCTGSIEIVNILLAAGADINAKESARGQTALMWAVAERHVAVVPAEAAPTASGEVNSMT